MGLTAGGSDGWCKHLKEMAEIAKHALSLGGFIFLGLPSFLSNSGASRSSVLPSLSSTSLSARISALPSFFSGPSDDSSASSSKNSTSGIEGFFKKNS